MAVYLGETPVDVPTHPVYGKFTKADWALHYIFLYGGIDGEHHKTWVLDQVARILNGTKVDVKLAKWDDGQQDYRISTEEPPTQKYLDWVEECKGDLVEGGEEGERQYEYDEGIAP